MVLVHLALQVPMTQCSETPLHSVHIARVGAICTQSRCFGNHMIYTYAAPLGKVTQEGWHWHSQTKVWLHKHEYQMTPLI